MVRPLTPLGVRTLQAARVLLPIAGTGLLLMELWWVVHVVGQPDDPVVYWGGLLTACIAISTSPWHSGACVIAFLLSLVFGIALGDMSLAQFTLFPVCMSMFISMSGRKAAALSALGGVLFAIGNPAEHMSVRTVMTLAMGVIGALIGLMIRRIMRAEAARRQSAQQLSAALEALRRDERASLARELHDLVGHNLASISLQLEAADGSDDVEELTTALKAVRRYTSNAVQELRELVQLLRDSRQSDHGTDEKLSDLLVRLTTTLREAGFEADVEGAELLEDLAQAQSAVLRYFMLEATTNILRHAPRRSACAVWVRLVPERTAIQMAFRNTAGSESPSSGGMGLQGLRERVAQVGGELTAVRHAGQWVLSASLPAAQPPQSA